MLKDSDKKREIGQIRARRLKIKDLEKILTASMRPHAPLSKPIETGVALLFHYFFEIAVQDNYVAAEKVRNTY